VDPAVSEALRVKYGAQKAYTTAEDLLADTQVEAVYIASPVQFHAQQVRAALDAGKHVLVEKPVAETAEESEALCRIAEEKGLLMATGLMMRFNTYHRQLKDLITSGKLGKIVSCHALFSCWYPDMPGNWRQDKARAGGGSMTDMGIHCLDLIEYITGSHIVQVGGLAETLTFHYNVEDSCTALLRLSDGGFGTVDAFFNIPDNAVKWKLEFYGTGGSAVTEGTIGQQDGGDAWVILSDPNASYEAQQDRNEQGAVKLSGELGNIYAREIESFGDSVLNATPLEVPATAGVRAQRVIEAIYRSAKNGRFEQV